MEGLFWIYISIVIGGILVILFTAFPYRLFGIIAFLIWPISILIYYIMKAYYKGKENE